MDRVDTRRSLLTNVMGHMNFMLLGVAGEKQTQKRQCGITILNHHSLFEG